MTDSFGTRLRQARERRNVSLEDIAARTKIKASLFEEIERDDASHWPAGIFRRSFMRDYARAVGLNPEDTVREFLQCFPDPADGGSSTAVRASAQARPAAQTKPAAPAARHTPARPAPEARPAAPVRPPAPARPPVRPADATPQPRGGTTAGTAADRRPESAPAPAPAIVHEPPLVRPAPVSPATSLRLTLVETGMPFTGGRVLADARQRWSAVAWDGGALLAVAAIAFVVTGRFWAPLALAALCYYLGGILLLGNSPGVCFVAPQPRAGSSSTVPPARAPRPRHGDSVSTRHSEPAFRARRWAARRSELKT